MCIRDSIYTQVFINGTDKCLLLFKNITANEEEFIDKLSELATDLKIEEWNISCLLYTSRCV